MTVDIGKKNLKKKKYLTRHQESETSQNHLNQSAQQGIFQGFKGRQSSCGPSQRIEQIELPEWIKPCLRLVLSTTTTEARRDVLRNFAAPGCKSA